MLDQATITQQLDLLAAHRRTVSHLVAQAAQYGGEVFAPSQTANGLAEARREIARIKAILRAEGVQVEDQPNDEAPSQTEPVQRVGGDFVQGDKVGGDKVMADKRTVNTQGGDYIERQTIAQGTATPPPSFRSVTLVGVLAFLGAVLVNIATSQLPEGLQPYLWLSWPLALLVTGASIWVAYHQSRCTNSSVTTGSTLDERNRSRMLDKVENFWIKGVLEQSLYQIARLELGLEQAPDKINHPWQTVLQQATTSRVVPAGTPIIKLFDDLDGKLLILGAPGAGKTTLLLELARDLIARARNDLQHPIPLVFNLSTWAAKRQPLGNWLAEELNQRYDVPKQLAQAWVANNVLLPLLDGLDEVAADHRAACVDAINEYRTVAAGFVPLAVCSRITDYEALSIKLRLQGAIAIQPLTKSQVNDYLKRVGRSLPGVRATLLNDTALWELMDSPLLVSIVALAYKDKSAKNLHVSGTPNDRRRQLFDDYIAAMFARPGRSKGSSIYTSKQPLAWLPWLACQMVKHNQTVFYIERMQPEWLPRRQRWLVTRGVALLSGLAVALVFGVAGALVYSLVYGSVFGLAGALVSGLAGGVAGALANYSETIESVEVLYWKWSRTILLSALINGLVVGLIVGLIGGLAGALVFGPGGALVFGLFGGLGGALGGALLGGLGSGLTEGQTEAKTVPNQGIRRSARNALYSGLIYGLVVGLVIGLAFGLVVGLGLDLLYGLVVSLFGKLVSGLGSELGGKLGRGLFGGLIGGLGFGLGGGLGFGLIGALRFGGQTALRHYTLRWLLYRNGSLPLRLVPFLDYCAERIFLRKVGGGYIFVHRLLMEHFASLYNEGNPAEPVEEQRTSP